MPLYEYQCDECGHTFEKIQKFSDPPIETCPKCSGPVHKMQSAPAFQFKGTGWYVTDYGKSPGGESRKGDTAKSEGSSASNDAGSSTAGDAAKPAETKSSSDTK
jgi:putative FmdB family regulatory protein